MALQVNGSFKNEMKRRDFLKPGKVTRNRLRDWRNMAPTAWYKAVDNLTNKEYAFLLSFVSPARTHRIAVYYGIGQNEVWTRAQEIYERLLPRMRAALNG